MTWYITHAINELEAGPPVVLIAEQDDDMRFRLRSEFNKRGWDVIEASDPSAVTAHLASPVEEDPEFPRPDLIVTDVRMPAHEGCDLLAAIRQRERTLPVILIGGLADHHSEAEARRRGAAALFARSFDVNDVVSVATASLHDRETRPEPESRAAPPAKSVVRWIGSPRSSPSVR